MIPLHAARIPGRRRQHARRSPCSHATMAVRSSFAAKRYIAVPTWGRWRRRWPMARRPRGRCFARWNRNALADPLLHFDLRLLGDILPQHDILLDEGGELLRRATDDLDRL